MKDFSSFFFLLSYARSERKRFVWALIAIVSASTLGVLSARALGLFVEKALIPRDTQQALLLGATIVGFEILSVLCSYIGRRTLASTANTSILKIRAQLFQHLSRLPMAYFDREPLGKTVTRLTYDVEGLEDFFSGTLARLLGAVLSLIVVVVAMMTTDFKLGLLLTAAIMPAVLLTYGLRNSVRHWNREFARLGSRINARLSEFLNGIPVIRSFGAEDWSKTQFDSTVHEHLVASVRLNILNSWSRPLILFLCYLPLVSLLWFGGQQLLAGTLSLGIFVTFVRYCERFSRPISALSQEIQTVQTAFTSAERVARFLKHPTEGEVLGANGDRSGEKIKGDIEFKQVSMSYDNKTKVVRHLNFHIREGEKIGLAGRTGSGKSTTVGLLARLYEYQEGDILLDGYSVRDYSREALRKVIGYVSQDIVIFRGTLRDNLSMGADIEDSTRIESCCKKTGLLQLIKKRGLSLDSEILDHGANLSMGERQLVGLTRVLLHDPRIIILDEATSNVDSILEKTIFSAVNTVMKGRTAFIVAHRLATLADCDRIFVFKQGEIVEQGTHRELLTKNGYFSELLRSSEEPELR